jgi:hypothetical protein
MKSWPCCLKFHCCIEKPEGLCSYDYKMLWFEFKARKSTQAAAFLLKLCNGKKDKYLLLKMIYLADRAALEKWNMSITGDEPYSMKYGPVPSNIYDLTKGGIRNGCEWDRVIETQKPEILVLRSDPGTDELSEDEMELLRETFQKYKDFSFENMKAFCHELPEYDPSVGAGSKPISISTMFKSLGKPEQVSDVADAILEMERLKIAFGE